MTPKPFTPSPAFIAAKARYDALQAALATASHALRAVPGIGAGPMGLTPDAVKFSAPYRTAKAAYDRAHNEARTFNGAYCRTFKRELAADRATRRANGHL